MQQAARRLFWASWRWISTRWYSVMLLKFFSPTGHVYVYIYGSGASVLSLSPTPDLFAIAVSCSVISGKTVNTC